MVKYPDSAPTNGLYSKPIICLLFYCCQEEVAMTTSKSDVYCNVRQLLQVVAALLLVASTAFSQSGQSSPEHLSSPASVAKSCYYHIRQLRCIRPYLNTKTASTIATPGWAISQKRTDGGQSNEPDGFSGSLTTTICYNMIAELFAVRWITRSHGSVRVL